MKRFMVTINCSDEEWESNPATNSDKVDFAWQLQLFLIGGFKETVGGDIIVVPLDGGLE